MGIFMVYEMEIYNTILRNASFNFSFLLAPIRDFLTLVPFVALFQFFIGAPLSKFLCAKLLGSNTPARPRRFLFTPLFTIISMCPLMSLVATLPFKDFQGHLLITWISTTAINLPSNYCAQLGWY